MERLIAYSVKFINLVKYANLKVIATVFAKIQDPAIRKNQVLPLDAIQNS
jgi:hypothetical protein